MKVDEVKQFIEEAANNPIETWPDYAFDAIPFAIFDSEDVDYVNHPSPPEGRPDNLIAATAVEIGEVSTATIPVQFCDTEEKALTLAYHEGFHVYQHHHFESDPSFDLFMAMASYPELDAEFRAICRMEVDLLNSDLSAQEKLQHLKPLAQRRHAFFAGSVDLLAYEHNLERMEGTASYVEQLSGKRIYGTEIPPVQMKVGWSRFYQVGAALCHLYDEVFPDWHQAIQKGQSLSDLLLERVTGDSEINTKQLAANQKIEQEYVATLQAEIDTHIQHIQENGVLTIRYPTDRPVYRAFNPSTMISLSKGRMLHRDMFQLIMPEGGALRFNGVPVVDDVANGEIQFGMCPVTVNDAVLQIETDAINGSLSGVSEYGEGVYCIS